MGPEHHNQQRAALLHYERWTKGRSCLLLRFICVFFFTGKPFGSLLEWFLLLVCLCQCIILCICVLVFVCDCSLGLLSASHYYG